MNEHKNSGNPVAELRKKIGKSQTQFAAMIGVSKHTVISVENGRNQLSRSLAKKIQTATGADLLQRDSGTPRKYTRNDFDRWRSIFYPSNEASALKQFEEMKMWLRIVLLAATKSGLAGNRDRLPAVCLSFREWLSETRQQFKLANEIEGLLEDDTRHVGRLAFAIEALLDNPAMAKEQLNEHDINFSVIKKRLTEHKKSAWLIVEDELRYVWDPFGLAPRVACSTRKLLPRAKCWIKTPPPYPPLPSEQITLEQLQTLSDERRSQIWKLIDEPPSQDLLAMPSKTKRKPS